VAETERKTGGCAKFHCMLEGGSFKAQPIEFWLFYFNRKPTDDSAHKYFNYLLVTYYVQRNISIKKSSRHK
jgi:hypothetical protein